MWGAQQCPHCKAMHRRAALLERNGAPLAYHREEVRPYPNVNHANSARDYEATISSTWEAERPLPRADGRMPTASFATPQRVVIRREARSRLRPRAPGRPGRV